MDDSSANTNTGTVSVPVHDRSGSCGFDSDISAPNHLQFVPNHHHHHHHHHHRQQQSSDFFHPIADHDGDNHDLVWPRPGLRSDPPNSFTYFGTLNSSSPSISGNSDFMATAPATFPAPSMDHAAPSKSMKNPKKRTRASRRAPTTVLTTDVTNFRQMVQEFTGIPASTFSGSPYSRSFDLFSAASALRTGGGFHSLRPFYPPRPSPTGKLPSPFSSTNPITIGNDESAIGGGGNNPTNYHQLFNLHHHERNFPSLQLGASNAAINLGNLSGFLSRDVGDERRWKSGETAGRNHDSSGIELGNHNAGGFDSASASAGGIAPPELSGYNLNNVGDHQKGMDNAGGGGGGR